MSDLWSNCARCGHHWTRHGDGLDRDRHHNCEQCNCPEYTEDWRAFMAIEYPAPNTALYGQIAPEKFAAVVEKIKNDPDSQDLTLDANSGSVNYKKVHFTWTYDPATLDLTITITENDNMMAKIAGNKIIFEGLWQKLIQPA